MYQQILKNSGLKTTHQRLAILNEIENFGHVQIDTLFETLHTLYPTLALGTLYRNIGELKNKDIIKEVQINKQKVYYETNKDEHQHFICKICGSIEDVWLNTSSLQLDLSKIDTKIDKIDITVYGTCKKCTTKE